MLASGGVVSLERIYGEVSEQVEKGRTIVWAFILPSTEVRIIGHGLLH
jgi:hypothetical protein